MADVLIYTANFGGYDTIREQQAQDIPVDWLAIVDDESPPVPPPWTVVKPREQRTDHPNLAAKVYKAQPPWELGDWTHAIWIDANMQITESRFAREAISYVHDGCAFWQHPRRDCVYDEAEVCLPGGKEAQNDRYENLPIAEQMQSYRDEGYPEHRGLFASGTAVWTPEASSTLGKAWLAECETWGFQDQLALPVVAWRMGIEPGVYGIDQIERRFTARTSPRRRALGAPYYLGNRWLRIHPHTREPYR